MLPSTPFNETLLTETTVLHAQFPILADALRRAHAVIATGHLFVEENGWEAPEEELTMRLRSNLIPGVDVSATPPGVDTDLEPWEPPRDSDPEDEVPSSHAHHCPCCGCLYLCTDLACSAPYNLACTACF